MWRIFKFTFAKADIVARIVDPFAAIVAHKFDDAAGPLRHNLVWISVWDQPERNAAFSDNHRAVFCKYDAGDWLALAELGTILTGYIKWRHDDFAPHVCQIKRPAFIQQHRPD